MQKETRACMPPYTSKAENMKANSWGYPQSALRLTAPSAEGALWWGSHAKSLPRRDRHRWAAELVPQRRQVTAALSAAVTTTQPQVPAPTPQAEPPMQKRPRQTPAALREGARGRGFSQRSRLPRIPRPFPHVSSEGVRGRGFSIEKLLPRSLPAFPLSLFFLCLDVAFGCRVGIMEVSCEIKERL